MQSNNILVILVLALLLSSCGSNIVYSPDKEYYLSYYMVSNGLIGFTIYDKHGKEEYKGQPRATYIQRFNFTWINNEKILFYSSDIGSYFWIKHNGTWEKISAIKRASPDKKYVLYPYYGMNQEVILAILEFKNSIAESSHVLHEIDTKLHVDNLVDCVEWDGNTRIILNVKGQKHMWKKTGDLWGKIN